MRETKSKEVKDQVENKIQLIEEVDGAIKSVCQRIKDDSLELGYYSETVKALAQLVMARALL